MIEGTRGSESGPASTLKDYANEIAGVRVPVVSHEIGEYQVASDFRQIAKYTGVVRARNLELFRRRLDDAGLRLAVTGLQGGHSGVDIAANHISQSSRR